MEVEYEVGDQFSISTYEDRDGYYVLVIVFRDIEGNDYRYSFKMAYPDDLRDAFQDMVHSMFETFFEQQVLSDIEAVIRRLVDEYDMSDRWYQNMNILMSVLRAVGYMLPIKVVIDSRGMDDE